MYNINSYEAILGLISTRAFSLDIAVSISFTFSSFKLVFSSGMQYHFCQQNGLVCSVQCQNHDDQSVHVLKWNICNYIWSTVQFKTLKINQKWETKTTTNLQFFWRWSLSGCARWMSNMLPWRSWFWASLIYRHITDHVRCCIWHVKKSCLQWKNCSSKWNCMAHHCHTR